MWFCCACSRIRRHVCGTTVLAVGTGGMCVALLCCSRYRRHVCGSTVPADGTGGMCGSALLQ